MSSFWQKSSSPAVPEVLKMTTRGAGSGSKWRYFRFSDGGKRQTGGAKSQLTQHNKQVGLEA